VNDQLVENREINECLAGDYDDEEDEACSDSSDDGMYGAEEEKEESKPKLTEKLDDFDDFAAAPSAAAQSADPFFAQQQQAPLSNIFAAPAPAPAYASASVSSRFSRFPSSSSSFGQSATPTAAAHMRPLDRFVHHQKANGTCVLTRRVLARLHYS
jgi:hypothetical protein